MRPFVLLLFLAIHVQAAELMAIATAPSGSSIKLSRDSCSLPKMPDSRLRRAIELTNPDNSVRWRGCWLESRHGMIQINWSDGMRSELPRSLFKWEDQIGKVTS